MTRLRVAFAGTPEFARVALERLMAAGFTIHLVLTQPDRPAGRGMKLQASPVKQFAQSRGVAVVQPLSLRLDGKHPADAEQARQALVNARPDVLVVAAYGLILPPWVLDLPRLGCLNIHASLLPRWRGAAPIHRAIEAGDTETGITLMQMDAGLDTGDMLMAERLPILPTDTTATLHDRLAILGGRLVVEALELAACGSWVRTPQPAEGVTYAHKIDKAESTIAWSQPADVLARRLRAFDPFPGGSTTWQSEPLKVWRAQVESSENESWKSLLNMLPGTVLSSNPDGIRVRCGEGILVVTEVQRAGGKRLPVGDFLRGCPIQAGDVLGSSGSPI